MGEKKEWFKSSSEIDENKKLYLERVISANDASDVTMLFKF